MNVLVTNIENVMVLFEKVFVVIFELVIKGMLVVIMVKVILEKFGCVYGNVVEVVENVVDNKGIEMKKV